MSEEKEFTRVFETSELPLGDKKAVDIQGKPVLICHTKSDKFFAVSNICSHAEETLECGRQSKGWIACPVHGARFDLETGEAMNPPATKPIETYELRIVDDWIEVAV